MNERGQALARGATFTLLAAFAVAHWATLITEPPLARIALIVGLVLLAAAALTALSSARLAPAARSALAFGCLLAVLIAGLALAGLAPRLLLPGGWEQLGRGLEDGLAGLAGDVDYPYRGENEWSRLVLVGVVPTALGLAAALCFWPAGETARRRLGYLGIGIVVALYATAVAANSHEAPLLRGAVLLALLAAWLWLPRIRLREALVPAALVVLAGVVAVPAAAQLRGGDAWLDYKNWTLGSVDGTTYRWEHTYGPLDWPRDGTRMLTVHSDSAQYWKLAVLDRFDGTRWRRWEQTSGSSSTVAVDEGAEPPAGLNPRWVKEFRVTVGDLESELVAGSGVPLAFDGLETAITAADGTTLTRDILRSGDAYDVTAYIPNPSSDRLRAAPDGYPEALGRYTQVELPVSGADGSTAIETVSLPPRSGAPDLEAEKRIARSAYAPMHELTREIVDGQPTTYDAVRAVQSHLRGQYGYSEYPPDGRYPLLAFLFDDPRGYCQQFSGSMALMLRMAGIPSRVVGGFAPGTRDEERGFFRVEDFDAHSWVEVYFAGIGWVAFDPTPSTAPVASQLLTGFPADDSEPEAPEPEAPEPEPEQPQASAPADAGPGGSGPGGPALLVIPLSLLLTAVLGGAGIALRSTRHRRLSPAAAAEAQIGELREALERFGWTTSGGATLMTLERRLTRSRRPAAARYLRSLRELRYAARRKHPPGPSERRAVRRELASSLGPASRLRALLAIPPGGPRSSARG